MAEKRIPERPPAARTPDRFQAGAAREENLLGKKIAQQRRKLGLSLRETSRRLAGYSVAVQAGGISKWEQGATVPGAYQLIALCGALEMEELVPSLLEAARPALNEEGLRKLRAYRQDLLDTGKYALREHGTADYVEYIEMPFSTLAASAGSGAFLDEGSFESRSFPRNTVPPEADFALRVSGDSMEPVYSDGQIVWVQRCSVLECGEVGIFVYDGEGYIKMLGQRMPEPEEEEFYRDMDGSLHRQPVLVSYNPAYPPRPVSPEAEFRIVGRVLGH